MNYGSISHENLYYTILSHMHILAHKCMGRSCAHIHIWAAHTYTVVEKIRLFVAGVI